MSHKDLISSGVLELYALGLCSDEERRQVEDALTQNASLRQEYEEICDALDSLAIDAAQDPPAHLKDKVMAGIKEKDASASSPEDMAKKEFDKGWKDNQDIKAENAKAAAQATIPVIHMKRWQWSAAASFVLLVGSIGLNTYYYNNWQGAEEQVSLLLQDKMLLSDELGTYQTKYQALNEDLAFIQGEDVQSLTLAATDSFPEHQATIYWDKKRGDVKLIANNLPELDDEHQYQLWAIDNEKPVGAGLVPQKMDKSQLLNMANISSSQAFAITIEKKGGAESPTLSKLVVIGKV